MNARRILSVILGVLTAVSLHAQKSTASWTVEKGREDKASYELILRGEIVPSWHIRTLEDEEYPTTVSLKRTEGLKLISISSDSPSGEHGYTGEAVITIRFEKTSGDITVTGEIEWQACSDTGVCAMPETYEFTCSAKSKKSWLNLHR